MQQTYTPATIIDVRSPQEFAVKHYPNAINVPLEQVAQRIKELEKMPTPIVAYCKSGNRSGMAVSILKQGGITDVINGGGLDEMLKKSL